MAKNTGKILGGLAVLGIIGAAAYAYAGETPDRDEITSGGMVLTDDCNTISVEDPDEFVAAWIEFTINSDAETWLDADERTDVEQLLVDFLGQHFPGCFPPFPGGDFTWITTLPTTETRTWDELVDDVQEALSLLPPGFEGSPETAPYDFDAAGRALTSTFTPGVIPPLPVPPQPPEPPIPPIPPFPPEGLGGGLAPEPPPEDDGLGAGGVWEVVPENIVQAITAEQLSEAGVQRAMEPQGALSKQQAAVYIVFDPEYPHLGDLVDAMYDYARDYPDILFITASMVDTQAAFGQPPALGGIGYAVNAATKTGKFKYDDGAFAADMEQGPLNEQRWKDLVHGWASGPHKAQVSVAGG